MRISRCIYELIILSIYMVTFSVTVDQIGEKFNQQGSTQNKRLQHIGTLLKSTATHEGKQLSEREFRQDSSFEPKNNQIDDWISKRLLNPSTPLFIAENLEATLGRRKKALRVVKDKVSRKPTIIRSNPKILRVKWDPRLLQINGYETFLRLLWGPKILHLDLDPRLLAPTWSASLLNLQAVPQVLYGRFRPMVLSPNIEPALITGRLSPHILRAAFEPRVLSPRIWPALIRIDAVTPEVLRVLFRPRVLSPDIDLPLFRLRSRVRVLHYNFEPKILSPSIRINLLPVEGDVKILRLGDGGDVLSPDIRIP